MGKTYKSVCIHVKLHFFFLCICIFFACFAVLIFPYLHPFRVFWIISVVKFWNLLPFASVFFFAYFACFAVHPSPHCESASL